MTGIQTGYPEISDFLNMEEASTFLRIKMSTLYAWVHRRIIPYRKHGGRTVFSLRELQSWSQARRVNERGDFRFTTNEKDSKKEVRPIGRSRSLKTESDERAIVTSFQKGR